MQNYPSKRKQVTAWAMPDVTVGHYMSESEDTTSLLSVLSDLQNRSVDDILRACIDVLTDFLEKIKSIYPQTEVPWCVIYQIRNWIKYVASKYHKAFIANLKPAYPEVSKEAAEMEQDEWETTWTINIRQYSSPDDANGKICRHTSVIQRISAK